MKTSLQKDAETDLLLHEMQIVRNLEPRKRELVKEKMADLVDYIRKVEKLNLDLKDRLEYGKGNQLVVHADKISGIIETVDMRSLIVYLENADTYKVYSYQDLQDFVNDCGSLFRNNGDIYEVIRDNSPQKLVVVIKDNLTDQKISDVKKFINDFARKIGGYEAINPVDIRTYHDSVQGTRNTEITVNSIIFNSIVEKDGFLDQFKQFLINNKSDTAREMASKLDMRLPLANGLVNARLCKIPIGNTKTSNTNANEGLDMIPSKLVSIVNPIEIHNNAITVVVNGDIYTGNNNNVNRGVINNVNKKKTIIQTGNKKKSKVKTLKGFCQWLYDTQPEWYMEEDYVQLSIIMDSYTEYMEKTIPESMVAQISKQMNGIIYKGSKRVDSVNYKKLVSYDDLKEYYMGK